MKETVPNIWHIDLAINI